MDFLLPSSFFHTIREALVQRRMWAGLIIILRDSAASLIFLYQHCQGGQHRKYKEKCGFSLYFSDLFVPLQP